MTDDVPRRGTPRPILRGRRIPRPVRWCIALSREESNLIFGAAHGQGVPGSVWGRAAMLRQALLQDVASEIAALPSAPIRSPRVVRGRKR